MKIYAKQVAPEYQESPLFIDEFFPENDSPLNINGCSIYCTSWSNEGIRKEIADAEGVDPANVVLYAFEGWSRTAQYKEVV